MDREIELKFAVPAAAFAKLRRANWLKGETAETNLVTSVYFDTPSRKLRRNHLSLRIRETNGAHIQGLKSDNSHSARLSERGEWEREIDGKAPDWRAIRGTPAEKLVTKKTRRKLKPVFETRVRRTVVPLRIGNNLVEVAIDQGHVRSGRKSQPIHEVELELKSGDPAALFKAAKRLTQTVPARLNLESKADQGYSLLNAPPKRRATPIHLMPDISAQEAFKIIASSCVKHFTANASAVMAGESEGIHQMRVGLRRLRAALSLFSDLLRDRQSEAIKGELKWLSSQLGTARDIDVFMQSDVLDKLRRKPGAAAFKRQLGLARADAFRRANEAVQSARYRTIVLDTLAWIEAGRWTTINNKSRLALRSQPILGLANDILTRRTKKITKKAKKLETLDATSRHKLRIAIKKLRYATDFFASLYDGRKAAKRQAAFEKVLSDLQDCLGQMNDIAVHAQLSRDLANSGPQRQKTEQLFAAGLIIGQAQCDLTPALKSAAKAARRLRRQSPFWTRP